MKKRVLSIMLAALIFAFSVSTASAATTEEWVSGMGYKFFRGFINAGTGWWEIPAQIGKGYNSSNFPGAFGGIFVGVWHALGRTISGVGDMAGFWAADPKDNDKVGVSLDDEYSWKTGVKHDITVEVVGNKLGRGLGNTIFGLCEIPGQVAKGWKNHAADAGLGKGIWYAFSREMDGIIDLVTFLLPNPIDTKALPFDEQWPWTACGENMMK
jgi:putative exosortase-associated protein (TIGR04073 family)